MRVQDVMKAPAYVVDPDQTLRMATEIMRLRGIHHLPVVDGGEVVGMISSHDADAVAHLVAWLDVPRERHDEYLAQPVREVLRTRFRAPAGFVVAHADEPLAYACVQMASQHLTCLPVVDDKERLVGMLSYVDLLAVLEERLEETPQGG